MFVNVLQNKKQIDTIGGGDNKTDYNSYKNSIMNSCEERRKEVRQCKQNENC